MNILMLDESYIPYTVETPYVEPLGGSETALTLLARGLHYLGHKVVVLNNTTNFWKSEDGNLVVAHLNALPQVAGNADVIIGNRTLLGKDLGKPFVYWCHDAYDQVQTIGWVADKIAWQGVSFVWCVSQWQKETFIKFLNAPEAKLKVLSNPIDYSLYTAPLLKRPKSFIYASIPFKGLEMLPLLWQDFRLEAKELAEDATLTVFSSMALYRRDQEDQQYRELLSYLNSLPGVTVHPVVSMKELAQALLQTEFYLHPSTYHETFGMVVAQAMAARCVPICTSYGALPEVCQDAALFTKTPNTIYPTTYEEMLKLMMYAINLNNKTVIEKLRRRGENIAKDYDFIKTAKKAEKDLKAVL